MKSILKKTALLLVAVIGTVNLYAQSYGEIRGIIKNKDLEPVPFATIKILQGGALIAGSQTDMDGKYSCKPLNPGLYELVIIHPEYRSQTINKISVNPTEATYVDCKLSSNTLGDITVEAKAIDYTRSGVDLNVFQVKTLSAIELQQSASNTRGDVKGMLEYMSSDVVSQGGEVHVRGARGDATGFIVDGVRTIEPGTIPGLAIENLSAFTGGLPAMYGDMMSGAMIITTKSYFSGMREKNMRNAERAEAKKEEAEKKKNEEDEMKRQQEIWKEIEAAKTKETQE
jgi:hypothetical protein